MSAFSAEDEFAPPPARLSFESGLTDGPVFWSATSHELPFVGVKICSSQRRPAFKGAGQDLEQPRVRVLAGQLEE